MRLDLRLRDLRPPRLSPSVLANGERRLREITTRNLAKLTGEWEPVQFKNRKEALKRRLMRLGKSVSLQQATADVAGRERLLLSLYLEYAGRSDASWLPPFDDEVVTFLLGYDGGRWHAGRRRQATLLFFTHFDRLPGLERLSALLSQAYQKPALCDSPPVAFWHQKGAIIFNVKGPQRIVASARGAETLTQLCARFGIPEEGRFAARLKEIYLLNRLEPVEVGKGGEILLQLEALRDSHYEGGVPLGAAALRVMVRRVLKSGGEWRGDWPEWILRLGCDPELPSSSPEFAKWWGSWQPTRAELDCARRAINRKTLEYFIDFLESSLVGTPGGRQFESRSEFLLWLDDTRKIRRFKLILHSHAFNKLPRAYHQMHRVAYMSGASPGTSVIVMECVDDVWIVEGTHSFAVRVFHKNFPLSELFEVDETSYDYEWFTKDEMHRELCPGIWKRHDAGWETDLLTMMKRKFGVDWYASAG